MATTEITDNPLNDVKRISTREARNQFSDLIGQVHYTGKPVMIERFGKPMVVMLAVKSYEHLLAEQPVPPTVTQVDEQPAQPVVKSLFGAFPELAAITDEDLAWAKAQWNQSLEKQLRIVDGLES